MKAIRIPHFIVFTLITVVIAGCAATQSFSTAVRAGDTVALGVGWQKTLVRSNITVKITPAVGAAVTYLPNDPAVRGLINLYPDPVSNVAIGTNLQNDLGVAATWVGTGIQYVTSNDRDWWQTTLFFDLPKTIATGKATITISDATTAAIIQSSTVDIVSGVGSQNPLNIYSPSTGMTVGSPVYPLSGPNGYYPTALSSLERARHVTLTFAGATIPQALQVQLSHTPSTNQSWVINTRGDIKNVSWRDNGTTITLLITASSGSAISSMSDLKVYIAGPVTGIAVIPGSLKTYDSNGGVITGITTALAQ